MSNTQARQRNCLLFCTALTPPTQQTSLKQQPRTAEPPVVGSEQQRRDAVNVPEVHLCTRCEEELQHALAHVLGGGVNAAGTYGRHTDRQTDRQAGRQADRQTDTDVMKADGAR